MRRAHAGNYYEPLPQNSNEIEDENERMTNELQEKVSVLKSLSIDIGNEVKYQDKLLKDVDDDMDRTGGFLGTTMNKVLRLSRGSHNYYILYLFFFSIFVFFILYLVLKFRYENKLKEVNLGNLFLLHCIVGIGLSLNTYTASKLSISAQEYVIRINY